MAEGVDETAADRPADGGGRATTHGRIAVAVAMLAGLTLTPALLGLARERIDRLRVRTPVAEPANSHTPIHRYTRAVARHPWPFALGVMALMLMIATPTSSLDIGHVGA